ncbi:MAG TPA: polyphosphate polymerase domain-containing protein [Polyangiaceae bacterium]|nr:polyphosphate polymerase domain-containing protein [Polyangiaceae bacterium]
MSSGSLALNFAAQDGALTAERVETKYLVPPERLPALLQRVSARLWAHPFMGESACPGGTQYVVTSVYFDTPSRAYFLAAQRNAWKNLKLRLREYSEIQEPSSELLAEPPLLPRPEPWLWLELKQREGSTTSKRRIRISRAKAASLFAASRAGQAPSQEQAQEQQEFEALLLHSKEAGEPLEPSVLVSYRRRAFQVDEGQLRVTIDLGIEYHRVPTSLTDLKGPLAQSALGAAAGREPRAVVEVKRLGSLPSWLEQTLRETGAPATPFSKFVAANEALHGAR